MEAKRDISNLTKAQGEVTSGWLGDNEKKQARGAAYASNVTFGSYFSDSYSTPQPINGRVLHRRLYGPVRDAELFNKSADMRKGIGFDTGGLTMQEFIAKVGSKGERKFEVSMMIGDPAVVVAKVLAARYTEGRVAVCRVFLHCVVKDIETIAINAASQQK